MAMGLLDYPCTYVGRTLADEDPGTALVYDKQHAPTGIGYCSSNNCARRFRCDGYNADFRNMQPHYYRVWPVEPCPQVR